MKVTPQMLSAQFMKLVKVVDDRQYDYYSKSSSDYKSFAVMVMETSTDARAIVMAKGLLILCNEAEKQSA